MPARIPEKNLEQLVALITASPGLSSGHLFRKGKLSVSERTLKSYLSLLVDSGLVRREGVGKATRYYPPKTTFPKPEEITLSTEALESRELVLRPVTSRTPVGYDTEFLARYIPNETSYLSESLRSELGQIGHIAEGHMPAGTYLRHILDRLLIDLSWNSSRLEGNTYSLLETQKLLEVGEALKGKAIEETQMLLNHKAAIELLAEQSNDIGFNSYTIRNLHALLSDNLLSDPSACGRLRDRAVGISGSVFHPLEVPQRIESQFDEILLKAEAINDPFEQALFAMIHLPYLQPFEDVNKRVSRLAANIPFTRHNLCPLSFVDVPREDYLNATIAIYELNRIDYIRDLFVWAYQRSASRYSAVRQSLGDPDPFRLRYREELTQLVRHEVLGESATSQKTKSIPQEHRERLNQILAQELRTLHEGNISRHRLRPSEFYAWKNRI